jgi:hypothetical protein
MPTVGHRLLREAIERLGPEETAARLGVTLMSLQSLRMADRKISDSILLKLIDLIDSLPKQEP